MDGSALKGSPLQLDPLYNFVESTALTDGKILQLADSLVSMAEESNNAFHYNEALVDAGIMEFNEDTPQCDQIKSLP
jgi:hypothetical protein